MKIKSLNRLGIVVVSCLPLIIVTYHICGAAPNGLNQIPIAKVYGDGAGQGK